MSNWFAGRHRHCYSELTSQKTILLGMSRRDAELRFAGSVTYGRMGPDDFLTAVVLKGHAITDH